MQNYDEFHSVICVFTSFILHFPTFSIFFSRMAMSQVRILKLSQLLCEESGRWTSICGNGKLSPC